MLIRLSVPMEPSRIAIAVLVSVVGCARHSTTAGILVPEATEPIRIDGELEAPWRASARSGSFQDQSGHEAVPYSEARFLRAGGKLYLALYASDEDIESAKDAFQVSLSSETGRVAFAASPKGELRPAVEAMTVGVDADGTIDDASDMDEEWIVEAAIPLQALPVRRDGTLDAEVSRCDTSKAGVRGCGRWTARLLVTGSR